MHVLMLLSDSIGMQFVPDMKSTRICLVGVEPCQPVILDGMVERLLESVLVGWVKQVSAGLPNRLFHFVIIGVSVMVNGGYIIHG